MRNPAVYSGLLTVLLGGCAVAYEPEPVRHVVPLSADAFDAVLEAFRDRYPRVKEADQVAFRIQSEWLTFQHGDVPGYRRASVFRGDDGQLNVIVEMYFLDLGLDGASPTGVVGDRREEQQFAAMLERVLAR